MPFDTSAESASRPGNQGQRFVAAQPQYRCVNFSQSAYNQQVPPLSYTALLNEEIIDPSLNLHPQYQSCQPTFYRDVPAAFPPFHNAPKHLYGSAELYSASSLAGAYPDQRTSNLDLVKTCAAIPHQPRMKFNDASSNALKDYSTTSMNQCQFPVMDRQRWGTPVTKDPLRVLVSKGAGIRME
ncbi:hypothetical protein QFC20_000827 [Naganishia adeliensis]|uniref:Uncharacterized protein n=1 Tax=Naganishia adeliensis TaxID=92952 RepID=A0ACC2X062_9TREE|nr:hypothetical protein QFC20_000827 [Naganishia adeliensis]